MTRHETDGFLSFHDLIRWLAHLDLMSDEAVIHLKKRLYAEALPPKVMMALLQVIKEIQEYGL